MVVPLGLQTLQAWLSNKTGAEVEEEAGGHTDALTATLEEPVSNKRERFFGGVPS